MSDSSMNTESGDWSDSSIPAGFSLEPDQCLHGLFSKDYTTDKNFDGVFTYSDLMSVLSDVLSIPADLFRGWIYGTDFGNFFEVSCHATTGFSLFLSAIFMIALMYSIVEGTQLFLERYERVSVERWWKKERKEKGYDSSESESRKE